MCDVLLDNKQQQLAGIKFFLRDKFPHYLNGFLIQLIQWRNKQRIEGTVTQIKTNK